MPAAYGESAGLERYVHPKVSDSSTSEAITVVASRTPSPCTRGGGSAASRLEELERRRRDGELESTHAHRSSRAEIPCTEIAPSPLTQKRFTRWCSKNSARSAVKQAGRRATKYAFTITSPSVSGLRRADGVVRMILQFARGPRFSHDGGGGRAGGARAGGQARVAGRVALVRRDAHESKRRPRASPSRQAADLARRAAGGLRHEQEGDAQVAYADVNVADSTCEAPTGRRCGCRCAAAAAAA